VKEWRWRVGVALVLAGRKFWCPDVVPAELEAVRMFVVWWFV
jgi:hypothetical protein